MESPLPEGEWLAATATRSIDGDTFAAVVSVPGLGPYPTHVRVASINAPERRRPTLAAGDRSKLALWALLTSGAVEVRGVGVDLDKYGRVIADVRVSPAAEGGGEAPPAVDVAAYLTSGRYAVPLAA
jgi:endonuclease YncB( thermonuclease family)